MAYGKDTKFAVSFRHGFLCWDFTDRREIWQKASALSQAGLLKFWRRYSQRRWNLWPWTCHQVAFYGWKIASKSQIEENYAS